MPRGRRGTRPTCTQCGSWFHRARSGSRRAAPSAALGWARVRYLIAPSGVLSPSIPSGRKTRIAIRSPKTIDRVQSLPGVCQSRPSLNAWMSPIVSPPSKRAGEVPDTAEHGRRERDQAELEALVVADGGEVEEEESPAAPASPPASANVNEIVRLTLMPIIAAASGSCEVARIALPCLVDLTSHVSASSTGIVIRMTASLFHGVVDAADRERVRVAGSARAPTW